MTSVQSTAHLNHTVSSWGSAVLLIWCCCWYMLCDNWFSGAWYECVWVFCNIAVNCDYSLCLSANQAKCFQTATTSYLSQSDWDCYLVQRCIRGRNCTYCKGCYFGFPRKNNPKRKEITRLHFISYGEDWRWVSQRTGKRERVRKTKDINRGR